MPRNIFLRSLKTVFFAGRWLSLLTVVFIVAAPLYLFASHGTLFAAAVCLVVAAACVLRHKLRVREQQDDSPVYVSLLLVLVAFSVGLLEIAGALIVMAYFSLYFTQQFIYPVGCEQFSGDESGPFPAAQSPDGKWTAQINEETCGLFGGTPVNTYLTIHPTGAKNNLSSSARAMEIEDVDQATVKWLDNKTVEIGLPCLSRPLPAKFHRFNLRYVPFREPQTGQASSGLPKQ